MATVSKLMFYCAVPFNWYVHTVQVIADLRSRSSIHHLKLRGFTWSCLFCNTPICWYQYTNTQLKIKATTQMCQPVSSARLNLPLDMNRALAGGNGVSNNACCSQVDSDVHWRLLLAAMRQAWHACRCGWMCADWMLIGGWLQWQPQTNTQHEYSHISIQGKVSRYCNGGVS